MFGSVAGDGYEAVDQTLSSAMLGAWVQFAKTGNPNGPSLPQWPAYKAPKYEVLEYGDAISLGSNADNQNVALFQRAFEVMRGQ